MTSLSRHLLGRKMVMFYLTLGTVFLLSLWDKVQGDNIMLLFGWIISAFVAGNIGEWKYREGTKSLDTQK